MTKQMSFADKAAKAQKQKGRKCPKCENIFEPILVVSSELSSSGTWTFKKNHVQICKCNEDKVYLK